MLKHRKSFWITLYLKSGGGQLRRTLPNIRNAISFLYNVMFRPSTLRHYSESRRQAPSRRKSSGLQQLCACVCRTHIFLFCFIKTDTLWSVIFNAYTFTSAVARWFRCCATNRKVAGSIPAGVSGFLIDIESFRSHYGPGVNSASNRNE